MSIIDFNATAWGLPANGFPGIPAPTLPPAEAAVGAAANALNAYLSNPYDETDIHELHPEILVILEAAAPHMLSHEREEARLAHVDAVVNAATVDRLEGELAEAKAVALREAADAWREYLLAVAGYGKVQPVPVWLERRAEWIAQSLR